MQLKSFCGPNQIEIPGKVTLDGNGKGNGNGKGRLVAITEPGTCEC